MPVNLHILTGFNYSCFERTGLDTYRTAVNTKLTDAANSLFDLVFGGVLARFPKLKLVYVENEVAWLPFFVHEWDKYYKRFRTKMPLPFMERLPGEYVTEQVYATFFSDPAGGWLMDHFGQIRLCGPMTILMRHRHGPIPVKSSPKSSVICPKTC